MADRILERALVALGDDGQLEDENVRDLLTPEKAARGKAKNGKTNITAYGLTLNLASTQLDYIVDC